MNDRLGAFTVVFFVLLFIGLCIYALWDLAVGPLRGIL